MRVLLVLNKHIHTSTMCCNMTHAMPAWRLVMWGCMEACVHCVCIARHPGHACMIVEPVPGSPRVVGFALHGVQQVGLIVGANVAPTLASQLGGCGIQGRIDAGVPEGAFPL